jgi:hypothetical protein
MFQFSKIRTSVHRRVSLKGLKWNFENAAKMCQVSQDFRILALFQICDITFFKVSDVACYICRLFLVSYCEDFIIFGLGGGMSVAWGGNIAI